MAVPTWSVGQVLLLTASDVNAWFVPVVSAYKVANTTRSTLTHTSDPDMTGSLPYANAYYHVQLAVNYAAAGGGISWSFSAPAGHSGSYAYAVAAGLIQGSGGDTTWSNTFTGNSTGALMVRGMIATGSATGTFVWRWASNTGPVSLTIYAGGMLRIDRAG